MEVRTSERAIRVSAVRAFLVGTFKVSLLLIGIAVLGIVVILLLFSWSASNTSVAFAQCQMAMIEKNIDQSKVSEYRRICMASYGYKMEAQCYVKDYVSSSCYFPSWVFWVNKI